MDILRKVVHRLISKSIKMKKINSVEPGSEWCLGFTPILILLIIVALGAVGYFGYKNYKSNRPSIDPGLKAPTTSAPTEKNNTDNWKTFTSSDNIYSLKYPVDWILDNSQESAYGIKIENHELTERQKEFGCDDCMQLNIKFYKGELNNASNFDSFTVNGYKGYRGTQDFDGISYDVVLLQNNTGFVNISIALSSDEKLSKTLFDQILSTFKFTDTKEVNLDISTWKDYKDDVGNFEFKYPVSYTLDNSRIIPILNRNITWRFNNMSVTECRGDCPVSEKVTHTTISGIQATKIEGYIGEVGGNIPQKFVDYEFVLNSGKYFVFSLQAAPLFPTTDETKTYFSQQKIIDLKDIDKKVFDQIVSTLKFN